MLSENWDKAFTVSDSCNTTREQLRCEAQTSWWIDAAMFRAMLGHTVCHIKGVSSAQISNLFTINRDTLSMPALPLCVLIRASALNERSRQLGQYTCVSERQQKARHTSQNKGSRERRQCCM
jgi:hypothetical protein